MEICLHSPISDENPRGFMKVGAPGSSFKLVFNRQQNGSDPVSIMFAFSRNRLLFACSEMKNLFCLQIDYSLYISSYFLKGLLLEQSLYRTSHCTINWETNALYSKVFNLTFVASNLSATGAGVASLALFRFLERAAPSRSGFSPINRPQFQLSNGWLGRFIEI